MLRNKKLQKYDLDKKKKKTKNIKTEILDKYFFILKIFIFQKLIKMKKIFYEYF